MTSLSTEGVASRTPVGKTRLQSCLCLQLKRDCCVCADKPRRKVGRYLRKIATCRRQGQTYAHVEGVRDTLGYTLCVCVEHAGVHFGVASALRAAIQVEDHALSPRRGVARRGAIFFVPRQIGLIKV